MNVELKGAGQRARVLNGWASSMPERHVSRGTSNANARGSWRDRARRRAWLLTTFGDGTTAPCSFCGVALTDSTITVDRIVPGVEGGRYVRSNIRPACGTCNARDGARIGHARRLAAA